MRFLKDLFAPKSPIPPPFTFPRMTDAKLAELINAITAGKVIQMVYTTSHGWGDMSPRSLEDYLHVFLEPRTDYVNFRVKPEPSVEEVSSTFATQQEVAEMGDKIVKTLEAHTVHIGALYKLLVSQATIIFNKETK